MIAVCGYDPDRAVGGAGDAVTVPGGPRAVRRSVSGDLVVMARGGGGLAVAVPVDIRRVHPSGAGGGRGDHLLRAEGSGAVQVRVPGDLVVGLRRRQRIDVAVPVDVGGEHRQDEVGRGGNRQLLEEPRAAVDRPILVPGDLVVVEVGRQDVHVPVAVEIGRGHAARTEGDRAYQISVPGRRGGPSVLVPGNPTVVGRGRQDVEVSIAIHIRRIHSPGAVG